MLLVKANPELKEIFSRLVLKMGVPVTWNEVFVIVNNNLILAGEKRSLIFNYEDKRAYSDLLDLMPEGQEIERLPVNPILTSLFNMTLYAFSKWGSIKGVKVEKDYAELNHLFQGLLKEIRVEPSYRENGFRFYRDGVQITYEDVIELALKMVRKEEPEIEEDGEEYNLGLWHNVCWKMKTYTFNKQTKTEGEDGNSRIGKNFYIVDYICPTCKEKLHMTVFPEDADVWIETEEGRVYLARAYTCNACNCFYTPKPGRLLGEGEVYYLEFEDDQVAYEDYLENLGKLGTRTPSFRLNEYEAMRNKKEEEGIREDALKEDKVPKDDNASKDDNARKVDDEEVKYRGRMQGREEKYVKDGKSKDANKGDGTAQNQKVVAGSGTPLSPKYNLTSKTIDELKMAIVRLERDNSDIGELEREGLNTRERKDPEYLAAVKSQLREKLSAKFDARMKTTSRMTGRQLAVLKKQIEKEKDVLNGEEDAYIKQIDAILYENEEKAIHKKADAARSKTYGEITRIIQDIENGEGLDELRKETIRELKKIKAERGKSEIGQLIRNMPLHMDRKQYGAYLERIQKYEDVDMAPYKKQLDEKRDMAEKDEIAALVMRAGKRDRKGLAELYEQLNSQDYQEQNAAPYLKKVQDKIRELDEKTIAEICPDIMRMSFREGLEAYEKINESMLLPDLKQNMLERIRRRITKIKTDENIQLVRKLKKEMERKIKNVSRLHFYDIKGFEEWKDKRRNLAVDEEMEYVRDGDVENVQDEDTEEHGGNEKEFALIQRALNRYAASRNEFEYPLLIGDSTKKGNGKKGFILTTDHIFYRNLLDSGIINILDVEELEYEEGKVKKGVYVKRLTGEDKKLPNVVEWKEAEAFVEVLNGFVKYLQEKPESRSIGYLAKEDHAVKCCYRCGHTYKGGSVCPKCGNKAND